MKTLAVIHDFLPRHQAGSELYCYYLCKEMQRLGHEVRVLCTETDHQAPAYTVRERMFDNLPVTEIVQHFHYRTFEETYRNPAVEKMFGEFVGSWRPDVVHFHHLLGLSFGCPRLAKEAGAAVVFTLHDYWLLCLRGGGQRFQDDGRVCERIDPSECAVCVAECGLTGETLARWAKQLLVRKKALGELDLRETLAQAHIETADPAYVQATHFSIGGIDCPAILAHPPSKIAYDLPAWAECSLLFTYAMVPSTYEKEGDGVRFRVLLNDEVLWERYLDPKHHSKDRGWHPGSVDLPVCSGKARLTLETQPGPSGNRDFCAAIWGHPRVVSSIGAPKDGQTVLSRSKSAGRNLLYRVFGKQYRDEARKRRQAALDLTRYVDRFLCPSPFLRTSFLDHGFPEEKLIFSDYGIRPMMVPRGVVRYPIRFTYIGSLVRHKGVHVLIRAFNDLDPERAYLRIHGPTDEFVDYVGLLRSLVRNPSIEFCGRFENNEIAQILGETDVLVVPSIWYENSPITIHEAFLAQVPVVTSRFGGMADLVEDGVNGLLFEVGNAEDLRRCLQAFVDNPDLVIRLRPDPSSVKSIEKDGLEMERLYRSLTRWDSD